MSVPVFIGWRYLKAKRRQTFISVITLISLGGVALGVTALIVVLAVMSGTEQEMKNRILKVNSHIILLEYGRPLSDYQELMSKVKTVPGVAGVEPFIYTQVMISAAGGVSLAVIRGIDAQLAMEAGKLAPIVKKGSLAALLDDQENPEASPPKIILGVELAQKTGSDLGDILRVVSPSGELGPGGGGSPRVRNFEVGGVFESGMYDYDLSVSYISLRQAQDFLNLGNRVTGLEIMVDDIYRADEVRKELIDTLGSSYWAKDWMQMNRNLFSALKLQKVVMFIILSLTILVAAFNIISTLIMVVMEKTRDIAILKSMGADRRMVMKIFVFQGLFVGIFGTLVGLLGGVILCEILARYQFIKLPSDVYLIPTLPVHMEVLDVSLITFSAIAISFLATLYPAWHAARLDPSEVLRYE